LSDVPVRADDGCRWRIQDGIRRGFWLLRPGAWGPAMSFAFALTSLWIQMRVHHVAFLTRGVPVTWSRGVRRRFPSLIVVHAAITLPNLSAVRAVRNQIIRRDAPFSLNPEVAFSVILGYHGMMLSSLWPVLKRCVVIGPSIMGQRYSKLLLSTYTCLRTNT
jgi:hypothetical protein